MQLPASVFTLWYDVPHYRHRHNTEHRVALVRMRKLELFNHKSVVELVELAGRPRRWVMDGTNHQVAVD